MSKEKLKNKNHTSHIALHTSKNNGITLIALIITIIVMLILTGVTLSITLGDNGLVNKAKEATTQTQVAMDRELLLSAVVGAIGNDGKVNLSAIVLPEGFTGSNGAYTSKNGNAFTVSENGEILLNHNENGSVEIEIDTQLQQYILGADLNGKDFIRLLDFDTAEFIGDEIISNANKDITLAGIDGYLDDSEDVILYINDSRNDDNVITYKFRLNYDSDQETFITDKSYGIVKVYEPDETRVGKTVNYDGRLWIILYDDNVNGLQMVSKDVYNYKGESLYLNYSSSYISNWDELIDEADLDDSKDLTTFEKTVYLYNNAIYILNEACKSVVPIHSSIKDVRSVGSNPLNKNLENDVLYPSEFLKENPVNNDSYFPGIANKIAKSSDENYIQDLDRIMGLGIQQAGEHYWLASRFVYEDYEDVRFRMRYVWSDGGAGYHDMWYVYDSSIFVEYSGDKYLRPVIVLNSDAEFTTDLSGEADYTLK